MANAATATKTETPTEKKPRKKLTPEEKAERVFAKNVKALSHLLNLRGTKTNTKQVKKALELMGADPEKLLMENDLDDLKKTIETLPKSTASSLDKEAYIQLTKAYNHNKKFPAAQQAIYSVVARAVARVSGKSLTDEDKDNIRTALENAPEKILAVLGIENGDPAPKKNKK